jgi:hypothetical protein
MRANLALRRGKKKEYLAIIRELYDPGEITLECAYGCPQPNEPTVTVEATVDSPNGTSGIEVIIWDKSLISLGRQGGHVSYIIDGVSYSWQRVDNDGDGQDDWRVDDPASKYLERSQKISGGTGYVLDFGSPELNQLFKRALIGAYQSRGQNYDVLFNNCGAAFARAINHIHGRLGVRANMSIQPSEHRTYMTTTLSQFIVETKRYEKTGTFGRSK